jgi:hypothetical protein
LKSERLLQLLLNDEQFTSAIVMNVYREVISMKINSIKQLDEKYFIFILDEVVYKLAVSELIETGR